MEELNTKSILTILKDRLLESNYNYEDTGKQDWTILYENVKAYYRFSIPTGSSESIQDSIEDGPEIDVLIDDIIPLLFKYAGTYLKKEDDSLLATQKTSLYQSWASLCKIGFEIKVLRQNGLFTQEILTSLKDRLAKENMSISKISDLIYRGKYLIQGKHDSCKFKLSALFKELDAISPALVPIYERLVEIKTELESLILRKNPHAFSLVQVQVLQDELREIDGARIDGKYLAKDGSVVSGQAAVIELLEASYEDCHELLAARDPVDSRNPLRHAYEDLIKIKSNLEQISEYPKWSIKGDVLIPYQVKLGQIDNMREDGKFLAEDGSCPPGQAVLHFLLHKCYRLVFKIQSALEPVADSLMPVYQQLLTLDKCLHQLIKWNVEMTAEEMIPYQMKLSSVNKLVQDGAFRDEDGEIPEGQTILFELLSACHQMVSQLQSAQ